MTRFHLQENERVDKRCAEIFLTTKGRITFHCTLCEAAFCDFNSYQAHLENIHLPTNLKLEIEPTIDLVEEVFELTQDIENYLDVELEDFGNALEKMLNITKKADLESKPISIKEQKSFLKQQRKRAIRRKSSNSDASEKMLEQYLVSRTTKNCTNELKIPEEIREVVKRNVYKAQTIAEEDRKHKCPICDFGFKDRGNMLHHFKRHSNERNHACSECDKKFYSSTELNSHIRLIHTKERTLLCNDCGRLFITQSALTSHLKRHRNQRDYHCLHAGCHKAFFNSSLLKNHMLSHSTQRHFPCSMCNASFKRSKALKNHMKLHENKREYKCQYCEADFNQQAGLFSHLRNAHKSI